MSNSGLQGPHIILKMIGYCDTPPTVTLFGHPNSHCKRGSLYYSITSRGVFLRSTSPEGSRLPRAAHLLQGATQRVRVTDPRKTVKHGRSVVEWTEPATAAGQVPLELKDRCNVCVVCFPRSTIAIGSVAASRVSVRARTEIVFNRGRVGRITFMLRIK